MTLESVDHPPSTSSQQARLDRLRQPSASVPATIRLADQIDEACDVVDRDRVRAAMARHDEAAAWNVLCDRGWPPDVSPRTLVLEPVFAWLGVWAEFIALPLEVTTPRDRARLADILGRLTACERALQPVLPDALWQLIGALDATGRATLSCALHALSAFIDARAAHAAAVACRDELLERFALFRHQARVFGVRAPLAPQDVRAWRATAIVIRSIPE